VMPEWAAGCDIPGPDLDRCIEPLGGRGLEERPLEESSMINSVWRMSVRNLHEDRNSARRCDGLSIFPSACRDGRRRCGWLVIYMLSALDVLG